MRRTQRPSGSLYGTDGRRKYLTTFERQRFMRAAWLHPDPLVSSFCLVLAYTGCRISEALTLKGRDINVEEGFIAFRSLKKRGELVVREVPIPRYLVSLLAGVHAPAIGNDVSLWTWSRSHAWQIVKSMMIEGSVAGGPHQTAKGLRHAFAIHAIRSGVPLNIVQRWLGHARLETTAIYANAIGTEERCLAERMWNS